MRSGLLLLAALAVAAPAVMAADPAPAGGGYLNFSPYLFEDPFDMLPLPDKGKEKVTDPSLDKFAAQVRVRPNSADAVFFVYANNPGPKERTLVVQLKGGAKGELVAEGRAVAVPAGKWKVVRFTKPAAPPPAAPPAPVVTTGTPVPAAEPPPPGVQLPRGRFGFDLSLVLSAEDDKKQGVDLVPAGGDKPALKTFSVVVPVSLLSPKDYLTVQDLTFTDSVASVTISPKAGLASDHRTDRPVVAKLTFPNQPNGTPPPKAQGVFARTLNPAVDGQKEIVLGGTLPALEKTELAIDGVERVAVFTPSEGKVKRDDARGVRVKVVGAEVTRPVAAFPVRVETQNGRPDDRLELRVRRVGEGAKGAGDEVIPLGGPWDEKVWVDVSEPTRQGVGFAARSADWVKPLDLSSARGKVKVEAVLYDKDDKRIEFDAATATPAEVVVDADPPVTQILSVGDDKAEEKVVKGSTVRVRASASDVGEAGVEKVTFVFYSRLQDDGTFPPDAVKVDGERLELVDPKTKEKKLTDDWTAQLPLPADKKGVFLIAAVATDKAGNTKTGKEVAKDTPGGVKVIRLVDPPAPGAGKGSVAGVITWGGKPQPGLTVILGGPDGKAKGTAKTDDKGKFLIKDVPAGPYTLVTAKPDSNKGFSGAADVVVEADKTTDAPPIELVRNK